MNTGYQIIDFSLSNLCIQICQYYLCNDTTIFDDISLVSIISRFSISIPCYRVTIGL